MRGIIKEVVMEKNNKKISELKPYEKNPRRNDNAVQYVKKSIQEFGFKVPIVITKDNEIITGHTRYKACQELGMKEIPCVIADDLTEDQIKAFRIADNKVADYSFWDDELLKGELLDLQINDYDLEMTGMTDIDIMVLMSDVTPEKYDDEEYAEYIERAEDFLEKKRIIITYTGEDETEFLRDLLKEDKEELKVGYTAEEIMKRYE